MRIPLKVLPVSFDARENVPNILVVELLSVLLLIAVRAVPANQGLIVLVEAFTPNCAYPSLYIWLVLLLCASVSSLCSLNGVPEEAAAPPDAFTQTDPSNQ